MKITKYASLLTLALSIVSFKASALAVTGTWLAVDAAIRYEKSANDRETKSLLFPELQFGLGFNEWAATANVNQSSQSDSVGSLGISTTQYQVYFNGQYNFNFQKEGLWNPYLFFGAGAYQNKIATTLGANTTVSYGGWSTLIKFGGGLWVFLKPRWRVGAELRESYSRSFNPEMVLEGALKLGYNL